MCVCVSGVCADMPLSHIRPNGLCNMCLMRQLPRHLQAYIRPKAKGKELLMVTRVTVFVFGIVTGLVCILFNAVRFLQCTLACLLTKATARPGQSALIITIAFACKMVDA